MKCDCGHSSDSWVNVKKYGFGSKLECAKLCTTCWYFSCFCNVEEVKKQNLEVYLKLKKDAERRVCQDK